MEDVKEIEQRVLNTLGMSKSRQVDLSLERDFNPLHGRSPKLDTPVRIDIYMDSTRSARSPRQLLERWSISVVKR